MKQQLLRYWLAMNASALQAGAHAAKAFFGVAGAHAVSDAVPALNLQQLASVFLLAFGAEILSYLDAHPLPGSAGETPASSQAPKPAGETPALPGATHPADGTSALPGALQPAGGTPALPGAAPLTTD